MRSFKHHQVRSIKEAISLLEQYEGRARLNAGGTDLLGLLKADVLPKYPEALIDIKPIRNLNKIKLEGSLLKIGSLVKLVDLVESPLIQSQYPLLAQAAHSIGSPQIRNMATLGGNLCQEVRCWYYRYPSHIGGPILCLRKGGNACPAVTGDHRYHAIMGGKGCFAVCPSDLATALSVYEAYVVISGPDGERKVSVMDFYHPLGHALQKNEMVKEVIIPPIPQPSKQTFLKFTLRKPIDFALVSVASLLVFKGEKVTKARIALGALSPSPIRAYEAEKRLEGSLINETLALEVAEIAMGNAKPLSGNVYKTNIAKTLMKRALTDFSLESGTGEITIS